MSMPRLLSVLIAFAVGAAAPAARAQPLAVSDAFTDGDFTTDPAWTPAEAGTWAVTSVDGNPRLSISGPAATSVLSIATPSAVSVGTWRLRFVWTQNLTADNGARVFLMSDREDLRAGASGYALTFGTASSTDEVRLVRVSGGTATTLAQSPAGVVAGDAGSAVAEVTRGNDGAWSVTVTTTIAGTTATTTFTATDTAPGFRSTHVGLRVQHTATRNRAFAFDDLDVRGTAGPPDTFAPRVSGVLVGDAPPEIAVSFSEPVLASTLTTGAFGLDPSRPFSVVSRDAGATTGGARLVLDAPLPTGRYALAVRGVADAAGNALRDTTLGLTVVRDEVPPALTNARVADARTVVVAFSEPVTNACDAARYTVRRDAATLPVVSVGCPGGAVTGATLALGADVLPGEAVVVEATGLRDAAGNTATSSATATRLLPVQPGDVVVNEAMSAPPPGGTEWVELFNRSARTVDLADLRLSDSAAPPRALTAVPTLLAPGAYAVVVQDAAAFAAAFPGTPGPVLELAPWPALNNDADAVVLRRSDGALVDSLVYSGSGGRAGVSLERRDPDGPAVRSNVAASTDPRGGTPGTRNSVYAVDLSAPVALRAERVDGGASNGVRVAFDEPIDPASVPAGAFSTDAGIPAAVTVEGDGTSVRLAGVGAATRVTVTGVRDLKGNTAGAQTVAVAAAPAAGSLALTEAMLAPRTSGSTPQVEYLELLNTSNTAIALRTLRLVARPVAAPGADPVAPDTLRFDDADRTLPSGGRLVVYDSDPSDGDPATASRLARAFPSIDLRDPSIVLVGRSTVTSGGLANDGECVTLLAAPAAAGADVTVVAPETCVLGAWADPARTPGASLERLTPASTGPRGWASSGSAEGGTPGRPASVGPVPDASGDAALLRISEVLYQPLADARDGRPDQTDFVEVVNTGAAAVDLNGLVLLTAPDERGVRDSVRLAYAPTRLGPGEIAVAFRPTTAVADGAAFRAAYPTLATGGLLLRVPGLGLSDAGDALTLRQIGPGGASGPDLDRIRYAPDFHSPALRTTTGVSLERIDLARPALDPSNWASSPSADGATPGGPNAVTASVAGAPERAGVVAAPSPFSPDGDGSEDVVTFAYRLRAPATSVRVRLYDARGRLVRTLPTAPAGTTGLVAWDGADDEGRALPLGIYVVLLDALDEPGARSEVHRAVVTIARRL